jgi:hypothetical protein
VCVRSDNFRFGSIFIKKITKPKYLKKNRYQFKPTGFGLVWFGFLGQKPVQTGLVWFFDLALFFRFGSVRFGSVFSVSGL